MKIETYFLKVLTPLHIGTGTSLSYIDLPIYREAHTDFPAIPSSSIKGVFRAEELKELARKLGISPKKLEDKLKERDEEVKEKEDIENFINCFGIHDYEGNLSFLDGRILFFPVKSLKGVFGYATCPYILKRFIKDANLNVEDRIPDLESSECLVAENSFLVLKNENIVVLEEFTLKIKDKLPKVIGKIPLQKLGAEKERVIVVSDDLFKFMVKNYTEVQTHIKVDIETGTVEEGALWTEEYVPAEAVFYFRVFRVNGNEYKKCNYKIEEKVIQLGGNSSTGKGFVEVVRYEDERTNQGR